MMMKHIKKGGNLPYREFINKIDISKIFVYLPDYIEN
jgi:hypothetical protein